MIWLQLLKQRVESVEVAAIVARELEISPTTLSLVLADKYPASTERIERKVLRLYSDGGMITCPILGAIDIGKCTVTNERARKIGSRAGNPRTVRLYKACLKCEVRNG